MSTISLDEDFWDHDANRDCTIVVVYVRYLGAGSVSQPTFGSEDEMPD